MSPESRSLPVTSAGTRREDARCTAGDAEGLWDMPSYQYYTQGVGRRTGFQPLRARRETASVGLEEKEDEAGWDSETPMPRPRVNRYLLRIHGLF